MIISLNEIEYCKYNVHCEANKEHIDAKRIEVLQQFKKAPVPGNRPGKASMDAIKMHYRKDIDEATRRALAEEAVRIAMFENELKALGQPEFSNIMLTNGKFVCEFSIAIRPKFELKTYKGLELPKPVSAKSANDFVEQELQNLRIKFADSTLFTDQDTIAENDHVALKYEAFDGDVKLDNLHSDNELIVVGKSGVPGLDQAILGMRLGEQREFQLEMPADVLPSLANKKLRFVVEFKLGAKVNPVPLTDDLAQKAGFNTLDELRTHLQSQATNQFNQTERAQLQKHLMMLLASEHDFQVPQWLVLIEAKYLAAVGQTDWDTLSELDQEKYLELGANQVKVSFILEAIREVEQEACLSDPNILETIQHQIKTLGKDAEVITRNINKQGYLSALMSRIRDEYTLDYLLKHAKIVE
jgi:trigger factor